MNRRIATSDCRKCLPNMGKAFAFCTRLHRREWRWPARMNSIRTKIRKSELRNSLRVSVVAQGDHGIDAGGVASADPAGACCDAVQDGGGCREGDGVGGRDAVEQSGEKSREDQGAENSNPAAHGGETHPQAKAW